MIESCIIYYSNDFYVQQRTKYHVRSSIICVIRTTGADYYWLYDTLRSRQYYDTYGINISLDYYKKAHYDLVSVRGR
jgi:hypothetical protein